MGGAPRVLALECVFKIEDAEEVVAGILRLTDQQTHLDEREHDIADVARAAKSPMFKDQSGGHAKALQRQLSASVCKLGTSDVPTFEKALLAMLKRRQHEEICALFKAWFTQTNLLHDAIAKRQLSHSSFPLYGAERLRTFGFTGEDAHPTNVATSSKAL